MQQAQSAATEFIARTVVHQNSARRQKGNRSRSQNRNALKELQSERIRVAPVSHRVGDPRLDCGVSQLALTNLSQNGDCRNS